MDLSHAVCAQPFRRVHRQRQAPRLVLRRRSLLPHLLRLRRDHIRRRLRDRGRLPRSLRQAADRGKGLDDLAADPLRQPDRGVRSSRSGAGTALGKELARHRRSGPRRGRAADLRLSHLGAVRLGADRRLLGHRRCRRRHPGLHRRLDGPVVPALHGDLVEHADALPPYHPGLDRRAKLLVVAGDHAVVQLDGAGGRGARRVPARAATSTTCARRGRWECATAPSCSATSSRTRWWRR